MRKKSIIIFGVVIFVALCYSIFRERHLMYILKNHTSQEEVVCDDSIWRYNAEKETVIQPCIVLTGTVERMHAEADGDENIQLKPDPAYVHLINIWNILGQWGNIAVEPICENATSRPEFIRACTGYKSDITLPHVGDHIKVIGSYARDKHGWMEIHPVTKIFITQ